MDRNGQPPSVVPIQRLGTLAEPDVVTPLPISTIPSVSCASDSNLCFFSFPSPSLISTYVKDILIPALQVLLTTTSLAYLVPSPCVLRRVLCTRCDADCDE